MVGTASWSGPKLGPYCVCERLDDVLFRVGLLCSVGALALSVCGCVFSHRLLACVQLLPVCVCVCVCARARVCVCRMCVPADVLRECCPSCVGPGASDSGAHVVFEGLDLYRQGPLHMCVCVCARARVSLWGFCVLLL